VQSSPIHQEVSQIYIGKYPKLHPSQDDQLYPSSCQDFSHWICLSCIKSWHFQWEQPQRWRHHLCRSIWLGECQLVSSFCDRLISFMPSVLAPRKWSMINIALGPGHLYTAPQINELMAGWLAGLLYLIPLVHKCLSIQSDSEFIWNAYFDWGAIYIAASICRENAVMMSLTMMRMVTTRIMSPRTTEATMKVQLKRANKIALPNCSMKLKLHHWLCQIPSIHLWSWMSVTFQGMQSQYWDQHLVWSTCRQYYHNITILDCS